MKISQTNDFELVAKLNKYVHDLHANLYPEYFKEYNFEGIKTFFQKIIDKEEFTFLLLEDELPRAVGDALLERGHSVFRQRALGNAHGVMIEWGRDGKPASFTGGADPRGAGLAKGY